MDDKPRDNEDRSPPESPGGGFWARNDRLLVFIGGLLFFVACVLVWRWPIAAWRRAAVRNAIAEARRHFESDRPLEAFEKLLALEPQYWRIPSERGEAYFLLGRTAESLAEQSRREHAVGYRQQALEALRQAQRLGVAPERRAELEESIGQLLHQFGRRASAIQLLQSALSAYEQSAEPKPADVARVGGYLVDAFASGDEPDLARALELSARRLALVGLSVEQQNGVRRHHAELLLRYGQPVSARTVLQSIGEPNDERPEVTRFLMAQTYFAQGERLAGLSADEWAGDRPLPRLYVEYARRWLPSPAAATNLRESASPPAIHRVADYLRPESFLAAREKFAYWIAAALLAELPKHQALTDEHYAEALLLLGRAYAMLGWYRNAEEAFERTINGFPQSQVERAARFYWADALQRARDSRALSALEEAVRVVSDAPEFRNRFLRVDRLRRIFAEAWQQAFAGGDFKEAMHVAELFGSFSTRGEAKRMLADAAVALARQKDAAESSSDLPSPNKDARQLYRQAASAYREVADFREASIEYADYLWLAAVNFYQGHAFTPAIATLEEFIRAHGMGERGFRSRLLLAGCHMAEQQFDLAARVLEEGLLRYPRSPDRFQGRLELARCYQELAGALHAGADDPQQQAKRTELYDRAEGLLRANVTGQRGELEPSANDWARSLFALGRLLREMGRYDEAAGTLAEAIERYPNDSQVDEARYLIAESNFDSAKRPAALLKSEPSPRGRHVLQLDRQSRLAKALTQYQRLRDSVAAREAKRALSRDERVLLRNCYFRIGDVYAAMEDWATAVDAYKAAANRYQFQPEALAAFVEMANAYNRMGRHADARGSVRQARWFLSQMDESAFSDPSFTKDAWTKRIQALSAGL